MLNIMTVLDAVGAIVNNSSFQKLKDKWGRREIDAGFE